MTKNQKNNNSNQNKIRNQLVGFATLLLIIAAVAPLIITDKSNQHTSTIPILQPEVVNQQNQEVTFTDNNVTNNYDVSYTPDSDQNLNSIPPSDMTDDNTDSSTATSTTTSTEQEVKPYMIQLTALKNRQKIEELVALLRLNNYNVIVIPKNPEPNQLIKLQVGPYAKKEQAEQVISSLNNLTKLKGIIVPN